MHNENKRILVINGCMYLPGEGGYKRTMYLVDTLKRLGYDVTLLTTDFNHYAKSSRDIVKFRKEYPEYSHIQFVHVPPYKKNISVGRWLSNCVSANRVVQWVRKEIDKYDLIFNGMPNARRIIKLRKLCDKYDKKMIVDVRDLFPEALQVVLKNKLLYRILTYPLTVQADKAYACADELIAVSQEYLDRALKCNSRSKNPAVVYLGFTLSKFDDGVNKYSSTVKKSEDEAWVTYAGTLGNSYDIKILLDAAHRLKQRGDKRVVFKILGQGPDYDSLKEYNTQLQNDNVDFVGFVDYEVMAAYLSKSDMAVNSLKKNAAQSIINKVADYFAAGIPIINAATKPEMKNMVDEHKLGLNYEPENVDDFIRAIETIIDNPEQAQEYGINARAWALEKFNRETSYQEIIKRIDEI